VNFHPRTQAPAIRFSATSAGKLLDSFKGTASQAAEKSAFAFGEGAQGFSPAKNPANTGALAPGPLFVDRNHHFSAALFSRSKGALFVTRLMQLRHASQKQLILLLLPLP